MMAYILYFYIYTRIEIPLFVKSILAKPWLLLYSFAVVCLLIDDTMHSSLRPPLSLRV